MAVIRQIITDLTTASGAGKVCVMYFESGIAVASQRTALQTFWAAVMAPLNASVKWSLRPNGIEIDDATGTLTGAWSSGITASGTAAGGGEPVPDAAQVLIRWKTSSIIGGRFLVGRTFVPGLDVTNVDDGNVKTAAVTAFQTAANAFIATGAGLMIWHRPIAGSGGGSDAVSTASVWTEMAVLRKRRG